MPAIKTPIIIIDMIDVSKTDDVLKKNFQAVPEINNIIPTLKRTYLRIIKLLSSY